MSDSVRHRGPDGRGEYYDDVAGVGLCHRRLAIIDLAATGSQPIRDASGRFVLAYNGEIYNYGELRKDLVARGIRFRGASDSEVLVNLWALSGAACLPRLNGIFAFAVYDTCDQTLHLVRDGIGVKPLYFAETPNGLVFASEIKAILKDGSVGRELDPVAIRDHLSYMYCPWPRTVLKSVKKISPGAHLTVRNGKIVEDSSFYKLPVSQPLSLNLDMQKAATEVRRVLSVAVSRQMVSDVPVGCFLSGGLDSSAITAIAKALDPEGDLPCYTADPDAGEGGFSSEGFASDLPYAQAVAQYLNVKLNVVPVRANVITELDRMLWHIDEPIADPAAINLLILCEAARKDGIKVMLGGAGGDDLFTGYRRHYSLQLEEWWAWLPIALRRALRCGASSLPQSRPIFRRATKLFSYADLSPQERLLGYFRWATPACVNSVLSGGLRDQLQDRSSSTSLAQTLDNCPYDGAGQDNLNRMLYLEMSHFLVDHNLNYTDKLSMAVGIEARVPFLDPDLVSLAFSLPTHLKQKGRTGKAVLKHAMHGILPRDVIYRSKSGFGAPLRRWMKNELKPVMSELLSARTIESRGIFDADRTRKLIRDNENGKVDASYLLFSMMCIERWCQLFLDSATHAIPSPTITVT